ncbi:MAG: hypothetical protein ACJAXN_003137 [Psychromonas sp.]|jgi:hypothetical protein
MLIACDEAPLAVTTEIADEAVVLLKSLFERLC